MILAQAPRYWHFLPLTIAQTLHPEFQKKKWATNHKSKDTLLSHTLTIEEKNVPLVFCLRPRSQDMTISSFEAQCVRFELLSEKEIDNISAPGSQIKKVKLLCFFKL